MARAPGALGHGAALAAQLGQERWIALQRLLLRRALTWASGVGAASVHLAYEPASSGREVRALVDPEIHVFAAHGAGPVGALANAAVRAVSGHDDPLLIVWPELPRWRPDHAGDALADLADGCQVSLGPVFDGGFYLVALAHPLSGLLGLPAATWRSADAMGIALAAAHTAGVQAGLLRPERALRTPADVRAALADPLLDGELRAVLEPGS
jgi:uncharacterized protein